MAFTLLLAGSLGFLFCAAFGKFLDAPLTRAGRGVLALFSPRPAIADDDLALVKRLISSLRAGISLDSALESLSRAPEFKEPTRCRLKAILEGRPGVDYLSTFLATALRSGTPLLAALQAIQKVLQTERRIRLKAFALTSQSRAQGEVLSWLPWFLLAALSLLDPAWLISAGKNAGSWFLWTIALALLGGGRGWMKHLLSKALQPASTDEKLQEQYLPNLCLRIVSAIALGQDAESALEDGLAKIDYPALTKEFRDPASRGPAVSALVHLLTHASRTGAPLRDDLLSYLADLQLQTESRWEERVQRLPVIMMAPLFLCFFPSGLTVLAALLLPLAQEVM
jgi:hypothetical protein